MPLGRVSLVVHGHEAYMKAGNAHLNSEWVCITYWFHLLILQILLVRHQLHLG